MKLWTAKGFGTNNLPDAINWHYAGTWDHMLKHFPAYNGKDLSRVFAQSDDLLRRAVALPILVNMSDEQIEKTINAVHDCIRQM
jgi:8-amino-3,8-dideoxy-alpha-D-manno-octulosonate transaminase